MQRVAVVLLGRVLSDSSIFGGSVDEYRQALLRPKDQSRMLTLAEIVTDSAIGSAASAGRLRSVEALVAHCEEDPLRLIEVVLDGAAEIADAIPVFPVDLFTTSGKRMESSRLDFELADAHLHSGASVGMGDFCRLMLHAPVELPSSCLDLRVNDIGFRPIRVGIVAAAIRTFFQWRLYCSGSTPDFAQPGLIESLTAGSFWRTVRDSAVGDVDLELWAQLRLSSGGVEDEMPIGDRVRVLVTEALSGTLESRRNCLGLMSSLTLLNRFLRSQPGEGLTRFVDRFEAMGLARDSLLPSDRARLIETACSAILSDTNVVGAEFRKTVVAGPEASENSLKLSMVAALGSHLEGMGAFLESTGGSAKLSMPIGLLRTPARNLGGGNHSHGDEQLSATHDLGGLWMVGRALNALLVEHAEARQFIRGIDVAGDELCMPNWPFLALIDGLRQLPAFDGIKYSMHAGESFEWAMQGLRSIGELLLPHRVVDQVGHALALDARCSRRIASDRPAYVYAREVVDDLLWLIDARLFVGEALDLLDRILASVGFDENGVSAEDLCAAGRLRRTYGGLAKAQLVVGSIDSSFGAPANWIDASLADVPDPIERGVVLLAYRGRGRCGALDRMLPEPIRDLYLDWSDGVAPEVRKLLIDAAVELGASGYPVVIESCPTSNVRLAGLAYGDVPLGEWIDRGLLVSLNSDDPLLFGVTVADEARTVARHYSSRVAELMAQTSVVHCSSGLARLPFDAYRRSAQVLAGING